MTKEIKTLPVRAARHILTGLILILLVGVPQARSATDAFAASDDGLFRQYVLFTGESATRQTVLTGFFLGRPTAELAVVQVDEDRQGLVRLFGLEGDAWTVLRSAKLAPGALFVDVANIGGRDRLITVRHGSVNWLDPEAMSERTLIQVAIDFRATGDGGIPHVDVSHDLNRNGRHDLLLPQVDGFLISIQMGDGSFEEAVKVGPAEPFRNDTIGNLDIGEGPSDPALTYGELGITASTLPLYIGRVHQLDFNLDGRSDLAFWNSDHFEVYLQDERGLFGSVAEKFGTDVSFDTDGVYSYAYQFKDQGALGTLFGLTEKSRRTVLHSIRDLSGDGIADLVTLTLSGRSFIRQRSVYKVHYGASTADGLVFEPEASTTINPRGKGGAMQPWGYSSQFFQDFDGDGHVDILFRDVNVGVGGMSRALVGNSVPINLEFYRGEQGAYPARPTARRTIKRFAPFAGLGNVFFPAVLIGDVNGDGRSDLLAGHSPQKLHVYLGTADPDLLARKPMSVAVDLPADERDVWMADLNKDARQDLIIQLGPTERAPDAPNRLLLLIAREAANDN